MVWYEVKTNEDVSQTQKQQQNGHLNEIVTPNKIKKKKGTELRYVLDESTRLDTLHHKALGVFGKLIFLFYNKFLIDKIFMII